MQYCKQCDKTVGSLGFCSICGTSIYVVDEKQYREYVKTHKSDHGVDLLKLPKKNSAFKKVRTKKFECDLCGKRFSTENGRMDHIKIKHPEY